MNKRVEALMDKVEMFGPALMVDVLELHDPLEEKLVGESELLMGDTALVHDSDCNDELMIVSVVLLRKQPMECSGFQAIKME